jgi:hypothetical protein
MRPAPITTTRFFSIIFRLSQKGCVIIASARSAFEYAGHQTLDDETLHKDDEESIGTIVSAEPVINQSQQKENSSMHNARLVGNVSRLRDWI